MVAAWTGVIWVKPMVDTASRIHSASGGVRASHALGSLLDEIFPGAMATQLQSYERNLGGIDEYADKQAWRGHRKGKKVKKFVSYLLSYRHVHAIDIGIRFVSALALGALLQRNPSWRDAISVARDRFP